MFRSVLCAVMCGVSLSACSLEDSKPYPQTSGDGDAHSSEGEGEGAEGEGEGVVGEGEGEGEGVVGEGEGEGTEGEGEGAEGEGPVTEGEGEGAEGEGEGPVCACVSNEGCDDGNFCNGVETCDCECSPGTPPDCADEFECTEDRCANNECVNVPAHALCSEGKICRPEEGGCVAPPPCRDDADCVPDDPCQTGACEAATRSCVFASFDGDEDGHAPIICGGDDCDDSRRGIHPEASESCNSADDNCDGRVDEGFDLRTDRRNCGECGSECDADLICVNGNCDCRPGLNFCGERDGFRGEGEGEGGREGEGEGEGEGCVDLNINTDHCGQCGHECDADLICVNGNCDCRPDFSFCDERDGFRGEGEGEGEGEGGREICVDLNINTDHCGQCGNECPGGSNCRNGQCGECAWEWENGNFCNGTCVVCDNHCVLTVSDEENCGACGNLCPVFRFCINSICQRR